MGLKGVSHWRFSSGKLPSNVLNNDLKPEIEEAEAHSQIAIATIGFFAKVLGNNRAQSIMSQVNTVDLKPLLEAMKLENSYYFKDPCNSQTLINQVTPKCSKGSPWVVANAQKIMGGDLPKNVKLVTDDNFHRVYTTNPVHLPQFNNTCSGSSQCVLNSVSVTEVLYNSDSFDTGMTPIAASEMRVKLMSRQSTQKAAGVENPDFH